MTDASTPPGPGPAASGPRAVAASQLTGTVLTGDNSRVVTLGTGGIPRPADVAAAAGMNNLPRPPAAVFVGRDAAMAHLRAALSGQGSAVVTQAVYGLGGVGKSELALHYARDHHNRYQVTWWITAEDSAGVEAGLATLAGRLCPEIAAAATTAEAAGWAVTWLQAHPGWLLILDNVSDPADVRPLLGQLHGGHIMLTTRRDIGWHRATAPVRLDVLDPGPAVTLITAVTGQAGPGDRNTAGLIAAELGFLPLALDQAAAYITQAHIPLIRYLDLLRQHPARMHATTPEGTEAQRTIARIWDITLDAIRQASPPAVELLHVIACYAPDNIPRALFASHDDDSDDALGLLASYSMITLTPSTVSIHRLLQSVILTQPDDTTIPATEPARDAALRRLAQALSVDVDTDVAAWPFLRTVIPHADSLASRYPPGQKPAALGSVLAVVGLFHGSQGDYERARDMFVADVAITEVALGPDHPSTARCLGNLASTYSDLGQYADALPLQQRALAITETALGPDHPSTAACLGNLASTYSDLGQHADALPLKQRALAITETALGPDHPSTALCLGNLAYTYRDLGQHADALPLQQRALAITETALGPDHPSTAISLGNLAATYRDLGQHADALPLKQRALAITETALGPDHPDTARRLGNLAATHRDLGHYADALPLEQRALAITVAALGPDHRRTALRLGNLAATHSELGQHADAFPLQQRALAITEAALGPDHPSTARCLGNLAYTYRELGQHADALPLEQRALAITETALGPDHPSTARCLGNLAATYRDLGQHADALPLQQRALAITEARAMPPTAQQHDPRLRLGGGALAGNMVGCRLRYLAQAATRQPVRHVRFWERSGADLVAPLLTHPVAERLSE